MRFCMYNTILPLRGVLLGQIDTIILKGGSIYGPCENRKLYCRKKKKLGMTQKQLAEKLGKSDKSVSKWERGICLPDVSVYLELCEILGISLNEFWQVKILR